MPGNNVNLVWAGAHPAIQPATLYLYSNSSSIPENGQQAGQEFREFRQALHHLVLPAFNIAG